MVGSNNSGINKAQLVGPHDGKVIVPVYDWSSFLEHFFKWLPNIKNYHHFRFSKDEPGRVYFKESNSSSEQSLMLLKNRTNLPLACRLPAKLNLEGLSQERSSIYTLKSGLFVILEQKIWLHRRHELCVQ